ncbi:MAG TPA: nuclear transport factor 2 family protein [Kofleriaceae bacterium]|nr:nuclear transport factor 2 family protein [Kofleriaceae bacterium]
MAQQKLDQFLAALGARRFDDVKATFAPDVKFRFLMPGVAGEADGADDVAGKFQAWFGWPEKLEVVTTVGETVVDRYAFKYRFRALKTDAGWRTIQQQGMMDISDSGITAIDLVCSGFRAE